MTFFFSFLYLTGDGEHWTEEEEYDEDMMTDDAESAGCDRVINGWAAEEEEEQQLAHDESAQPEEQKPNEPRPPPPELPDPPRTGILKGATWDEFVDDDLSDTGLLMTSTQTNWARALNIPKSRWEKQKKKNSVPSLNRVVANFYFFLPAGRPPPEVLVGER